MQLFERKFALNSVIKIYSKMWELCMHPDYDYLYIPLTSEKDKFQPQTNIFLGNNNPISIKPNRKKLILPIEKYFRTLKDMIIATD